MKSLSITINFLEEFLQRKGPVGHVASTGVLFDNFSITSTENLSIGYNEVIK